MYLKHKGKGADTIKKFDKAHGNALLKTYDSWEKPTKAEVKSFEKKNNVVNDSRSQGDFIDSNEQQDSDK